jgi:DNA repair exonuclease SbcCD ATPase subunit
MSGGVLTLSLKNFRCWENKTFTFQDNGIVLISGISGKGKSTLLNAILFVITGNVKNVVTFGKEKANMEVVLSIQDLVITRGKNPTRFTVKQGMRIYEEDQAQNIINSYFGCDFKHISYIDQDNSNSFVYLSPEAKMTFLRNLLLSAEPIDDIKDKIKTKMDACKKELISEEATLTTSLSFLKTLQYKENVCKIGKRNITVDNYTDTIETQRANLDTSKKNRIKLITKCSGLEKDFKTYTEQSARLTKLVEIKDELDVYDIDSLTDRRDELVDKKKNIENHSKYIEERKTYLKQVEELAQLKIKLDTFHPETFADIILLEKMLKHYQSICSLESQIGEDKEEALTKSSELLKSEISHIQRVLDQQHVYECPSCQVPLKMNNGILKKVDAFVKEIEQKELSIGDLVRKQQQLDRVFKDLTLLERATTEYNSHFDALEDLLKDTVYNTETDFAERIATLKKEERAYTIALNSYTTLSQKVDAFVDSGKSENGSDGSDDDLFVILEKLATINQSIKRYNDLQQRISAIQTVGFEMIEDPSDAIVDTKQKIDEYEQKINVYTTSIDQLQEWKRVDDANQKFTELSSAIQRSKDAKEYLVEELKCCEKLMYFVKDAETRSIHQFIDSLNKHAGLYIEDFFPDEDIRVELVTNKELKSGKDKLGLFFDVSYKTIKGDIDFLSGGQRDRVNLAFTLAFSELVQNKMLLLDECISSLDSETSDTVVDTLKEKYKGKLVMCVAHQVNTGVFDQVLNV